MIELLGGVLFLAAFWKVAPHLVQDGPCHWSIPTALLIDLSVSWIWIALMIVGSMIDFDHKLLPDFVTVGGMILGLLAGGIDSCRLQSISPAAWSVAGLVFGFGLLWLIRFFGSKAFKREAMGLGDVFLMGAVGALFGPVAVLVTLILSSVFGSIVGVSMIALSKTKFGRFVEIPYGPYICLGCLTWMFCGPELVNWYLALMRP